jgi:hypothetical protein
MTLIGNVITFFTRLGGMVSRFILLEECKELRMVSLSAAHLLVSDQIRLCC